MKVSIIVPLHNLADFVSETINSALRQSYTDLEVIIVDDASTDISRQVAQEYVTRDERIKLIALDENVGLPAARNIAIAASTGEFILPLDADDWIDNQYLEKTLQKMAPDVGVVATYMTVFGYWPHRAGAPGSGYPIFYPTKQQILNGNTLPVCSLVRKQTALDVGGYPECMRNGSEDWAFWASIICKTNWKVEIVPEFLFHYRTRPGSMSRQATMAPFEASKKRIQEMYGS
jgi:glycosyltransferase involved in cell wall biosynthesis